MKIRRHSLPLSLLLLSIAAVGCDRRASNDPGSSSSDAAGGDPLNLAACKLLKDGPFVPVAGQALFNMDAPEVKADQKSYRISIAKRQSAHVLFKAPVEGTYLLFTNITIPVTVFGLDGEMFNYTNLRTSAPECPEIQGRITIPLKTDGNILRLRPDNAVSVDLVILRAQ
jgi:hypothetical protein